MKISKKNCEKGWKWVKVGEDRKMPYPQCGRSIKTYTRGNNDAPSITKYGSPVRLDAQMVALCPHCTKGAPVNQAKKHLRMCGTNAFRTHSLQQELGETSNGTFQMKLEQFNDWFMALPLA